MTRILIVDDQRQNLYLLETLLKSHGFEVASAENGAVALELARNAPPAMIIADILMPVMDGFELYRQWKSDARLRSIPFIFYTATYTDIKDEEFSKSLGADRFLTKPQQPEVLLQIIQETLVESDHVMNAEADSAPVAEVGVLQKYNEALFRRLERKMLQLENEIDERKQAEAMLSSALEELEKLKNRLAAENVYLQSELAGRATFDDIVGDSAAMRQVLFRVEQVAPTDATVLLCGETGTGKGLVAKAIHKRSPRKDKPFVTVNCSALPATLVESELFGRERGSFTGATSQIGRFELADGGTLFLDEVGDLPLELQPKLLRAVQDGEFERVGSPHTTRVNVRIIAATHRNLAEEAQKGAFRKDLYYRLNLIPLALPALREHKDDISALLKHLVEKFARRHAKSITAIHASVINDFMAYDWPGNVRELENIVERAVITSPGSELRLSETLASVGPRTEGVLRTPQDVAVSTGNSLDEVERTHIVRTLETSAWMIEGSRGAAAILGINPSTLRGRMRKLGIRRQSPRG
ncbi:MAG: sigma-54-dependent Fis family transcriptional regulator [Candidatus Hydrogenedentes bacterium]|nr:sigma-54-dependent Fis family transcriptional regulator [Candidatus Hydrogenedentota bacterium]